MHSHIFSIQWTANPRAQEVISQLDDLPNLRQVSLHYTQDLMEEFQNLLTKLPSVPYKTTNI